MNQPKFKACCEFVLLVTNMMCVRPLDGTFACDHVRTRFPSPSSSMFTPGVESELVPRPCLELVWFEHTNKKASVLIFWPGFKCCGWSRFIDGIPFDISCVTVHFALRCQNRNLITTLASFPLAPLRYKKGSLYYPVRPLEISKTSSD